MSRSVHLRSMCECHDGLGGPSCAEARSVGPACPSACSGHGLCHDGGCVCESGFGGDDCGVVCHGGCSGHGRCTDEGACVCEAGWWGELCTTPSLCLNACSGRGECRVADDANSTAAAAIVAEASAARLRVAAAKAATYVVEARELASAAAARAHATSAAARAAAEPRCHCAAGWRGTADCSVADGECPVGCSGHGRCEGGVCACEHGWRGPHCATSDVLARNAMLAEVGLLGE